MDVPPCLSQFEGPLAQNDIRKGNGKTSHSEVFKYTKLCSVMPIYYITIRSFKANIQRFGCFLGGPRANILSTWDRMPALLHIRGAMICTGDVKYFEVGVLSVDSQLIMLIAHAGGVSNTAGKL